MVKENMATIKKRAGFVIVETTEGKIVLTEEEFERFLKRGRSIKAEY